MKKWKVRKAITKTASANLSEYPPFLRDILFSRGLVKKEQAENFLNPSYARDLYDPFLIKGMKKAVSRINLAIKNKEKIVVYGDYDADGVPGTVVLTSFFREIGFTDFDIFIPDRHTEGYGLKDETLSRLATEGAKLIITIDCGIVDVSQSKKAYDLGMEMIITDHHLPQDKLPKAVAILDSKQAGDNYPDKMLCGAGVAFKLVQALIATNEAKVAPGWEKWLLDLVAIATVSDMVPLVNENRALAYFGLKVLRKTRRVGLLELLKTMKLKAENLTEDDIGFMLAPRLNAASRMSHAVQSYFLLTTSDTLQAKEIAKHLEEKNKERKKMVDHIMEVIEERIKELETLPPVLVFGDPTWSAGGLGLVASKIKDKYNKTVFIWGGNDEEGIEKYKGSARSTGEVNLVKLMQAAGGNDFFADFGGHFMAAGFSFLVGREVELVRCLNEAYSHLDKEKFEEEILIDKELTLDDITWDNYYYLEELAPYGMGNPKPIFCLRGIEISRAKVFGNGGIHLELQFFNKKGKPITAIGFFTCTASEKFDTLNGHIFKGVDLSLGQKIDALVTIEKSTFKNYPELRLRIVDLRSSLN